MSARIPTSSSSILVIPRHLHKHRRFQTSTAASLKIRTAPFTAVARPFSYSSRLTYPRKDSQDKDSINTEATEYSKSATDDEGARQEDAAFNPDVTNPQEQKDMAGKNRGVNTTQSQKHAQPARFSILSLQLSRAMIHFNFYIHGGIKDSANLRYYTGCEQSSGSQSRKSRGQHASRRYRGRSGELQRQF